MSQTSISRAETAKPLSRVNRRATIRYRCAPATVGKVFSADDQEFQRAWIIDLSLRGIGMQLPRLLEPGQLIVITIRSNDGTQTYELSARVMRCDSVPHDDWYVGCELMVMLSPEELDRIL